MSTYKSCLEHQIERNRKEIPNGMLHSKLKIHNNNKNTTHREKTVKYKQQVLWGTVIWAKQSPIWGIQLTSLAKGLSQLGLLPIFDASWTGGNGHKILTWVFTRSLPSVVYNSMLIVCGLGKSPVYVGQGRLGERGIWIHYPCSTW